MNTFKFILATVAMCLLNAPAFAVPPNEFNQTGYQREFKLLDTDGNSKLNVTEIKKDSLFNNGGFAKADKNHNGSLDESEFATYKSTAQQKEVKRVASDSAITTKIKSKYLVEKNFKSYKVSVETKDGIVALSGFVDNESTKTSAGQIAAKVDGVKSVKNGLVVKP